MAAVGHALYCVSGSSGLAVGLAQAQKGDGAGLLALSDGGARATDGHYSNVMDAAAAIGCLDSPWPHDATAMSGPSRWRRELPRCGGDRP